MLRITLVAQDDDQAELRLAGRLAGDAVILLDAEMARWLQSKRCLLLNLEGVQDIDSSGLALLRGYRDGRLLLRGASPYVQALMKT